MTKLFQNKKLVITLSIVLAVMLAAGVGILVWQLTKDDASKTDTYTITFVSNGGNEIPPMKVEKGTVLSQAVLPVPAKRGFMFLTWNTDEALTVPYWNAPIESDMTLYASYLEPASDEDINELIESIIPFAKTDFSVTVRSSIELTNDNIGNYVVLTVKYGKHENGEEIRLSVTSEGGDLYRIAGNFASGGEYAITLVSDAVTFNAQDETLLTYGLTEQLRTLHFRIIGEAYMEGELSDKVADIPDENIVMKDDDSITVSGSDLVLVGVTEAENGVIRVGDGDDISNYYKIVGIESSTADEITYTVRPAEVEEIYDNVQGYQWEDLDEDDYVINEEVKQQVIENLSNNEQIHNYVKYMALASTYTPTYQTLSTQEFGEVVAMPLSTVVIPSGFKFGLDFNAYNDKFSHILDKDQYNKFVKVTIGASYEVKIAKLGKVGSVTAVVDMEVSLWVFVGMGGEFKIGWGTYDIDYGVSALTQTEITFTLGLQTSSGKKYPNIDDEIEAIFNSAENPTPENLLEQYNELMGGGSQFVELFNQEIFMGPKLSLLWGAIEISIPVKFVVSLDIEASFTNYFTVLTADAFGVRGNEDDGLDTFHIPTGTRYKYRLELKGRLEVRAGIEVGIKLSLAYDLASVSLNAQAGFYIELHGYFYYEIDRMNPALGVKTSKGGAYYFEFGTYIDIRLRAEVCFIKYSGSLWDIKFPLYSMGQKEILYGFVNPTDDVILMENVGSVYIDDTGILDVYVYDITKERSDTNPRIVENYPFEPNRFELTLSNDNFRTYSDELYLNRAAKEMAYEAILTMKYTGSQMSFRDCITKYVTVRFTAQEGVDWDKLGTTCTVDFTIDGEVIFSREVAYGGRVSLWSDLETLSYQVREDGSVSSDLRFSEIEALYNAGYGCVEWIAPTYITEDMSVEAIHGVGPRTKSEVPAMRKIGYVVQTPMETIRDQTVLYGEIPDLSKYESDEYCFDDRMTFDRWSIEPAPLTEEGVVYSAIYKPIMVTVSVEVAGTTDGETVYEAKTYSDEVNKGGFVKDLFEMVPQIGRKTLVFYSDAAYTKQVIGYPQIDDAVTYYARYEDHAYVYFYNQYYEYVLTKKVDFGETVTLTDEEMALFTYCDPAEVAKGVRFIYKGLNHTWLSANEVIDLSELIADQYSTSVFPVFDKEYRVTFLNSDGSVLEEVYCIPNTRFDSFDLVPTIGPDGGDDYVFLGWIKENGAPIVDITEPVTLTPNFEKDLTAYTVTFLYHDERVFDTKYLMKGEDVSSVRGPGDYFDERYNYVFSHWENVDGAEFGTTVRGDSTFKAVYTIKSDMLYTVTFVGAGDAVTENGEPVSLSEQYKYDELENVIGTYLNSGTITKKLSGYTYVLDSYTIKPNMGGICLVDLTFVVAEANVTFKTDGGTLTYGTQAQNELTIDFAIDEDGFLSLERYAVTPSDTSKAFAGWLVDGVSYAKNAKIPAKVGQKLTITAVFENKPALTLVNGDRSEIHYAQQGEQILLPTQTKQSTAQYSYTFAGWKAEDGSIYQANTFYTVTGNATLTAQFTQTVRSYTITFDANGGTYGGSGVYTKSFAYGAMPTTSLADPTRKATATARYEFAGWSPTLSAVTGEATYTAQWKEIKLYTVTFDAGEGQFDSNGKRAVTITVDEGYALTSYDFPLSPYKKTDAGYYEFSAWSPAATVGTVINGNVTYTATYQSTLSTRTGITISDGVNTEDIAAFLNGTSKISGYTYVLDHEYFGKALTITANGLILSGEAKDIHIEVYDVNVTLADLSITYTEHGYISLLGVVEVTVDGTVRIISEKENGDTIRGDGSDLSAADITLRGADANSKLIIDSVQYGIAVYGTLTVADLDMDLTVSPSYEHAAAIQAHDSGESHGILTVVNSDIVINEGMVNAARLIMTNSNLQFKAETFTPGAADGLFVMSYSDYITENDSLIDLTASSIYFTHDIAIAIALTVEEKEYYINSDIESFGIAATYQSFDAFLADIAANGYSGMIVMDSSSAIA